METLQTSSEKQALQSFVEGFEALLETNGAKHFFDSSETFDCAAWVAGRIGKPYLAACEILGREPIEAMGGKVERETTDADGVQTMTTGFYGKGEY